MTQINTILLVTIRAEIFPDTDAAPVVINERFQKRGELLEARDENIFQRETPERYLESVLLLQQNPELKARSAATLRAMWRTAALVDSQVPARSAPPRICSWKFCASRAG